MSDEPLALSTVPPALPAEQDFDAICSTVMATARGRWFLQEYAKRNRNADTSQVLDAIARMQAAVDDNHALKASREVRLELHEMARAIAQVRSATTSHRTEGPAAAPDIAGAAGRLREIASAMRACGIEPAMSEQIGQLANAILSAASLRNPDDQRAHKLGEVLLYLEHRIDRMLDGHAEAAADGGPPAREDEPPQTTLEGEQPDPPPEHVAQQDVAPVEATKPAPIEAAFVEMDLFDLMREQSDAARRQGTTADERAQPDSAIAAADDGVIEPVATQVDRDLEDLFDTAEEAPPPAAAPAPPACAPSPAPLPRPTESAATAPDEEPADFLLEPAPGAVVEPAPAAASPAGTRADMAKEARAAQAQQPASPAEAAIASSVIAAQAIAAALAATSASEDVTSDPLAALNALTDEEKIALFT